MTRCCARGSRSRGFGRRDAARRRGVRPFDALVDGDRRLPRQRAQARPQRRRPCRASPSATGWAPAHRLGAGPAGRRRARRGRHHGELRDAPARARASRAARFRDASAQLAVRARRMLRGKRERVSRWVEATRVWRGAHPPRASSAWCACLARAISRPVIETTAREHEVLVAAGIVLRRPGRVPTGMVGTDGPP